MLNKITALHEKENTIKNQKIYITAYLSPNIGINPYTNKAIEGFIKNGIGTATNWEPCLDIQNYLINNLTVYKDDKIIVEKSLFWLVQLAKNDKLIIDEKSSKFLNEYDSQINDSSIR